jgi:hypothetical protein
MWAIISDQLRKVADTALTGDREAGRQADRRNTDSCDGKLEELAYSIGHYPLYILNIYNRIVLTMILYIALAS